MSRTKRACLLPPYPQTGTDLHDPQARRQAGPDDGRGHAGDHARPLSVSSLARAVVPATPRRHLHFASRSAVSACARHGRQGLIRPPRKRTVLRVAPRGRGSRRPAGRITGLSQLRGPTPLHPEERSSARRRPTRSSGRIIDLLRLSASAAVPYRAPRRARQDRAACRMTHGDPQELPGCALIVLAG